MRPGFAWLGRTTEAAPDQDATRTPWFIQRRWQRVALCAMVLILVGESVQAIFFRENDVANHYQSGRKLLGLQPLKYNHPLEYWYVPYPAGRATLNALVAWLPYHSFRAVCYLLGVAGLIASFRMWERMARTQMPVRRGVPLSAASVTCFLLVTWIVRDLDDCGLQMMLLFMLTSIFDLCRRGKQGWAGVWLGIAIVFKASPLLFVPVLALTGRWKACLTAGLTTVLLSASPAPFVGWSATWDINTEFVKLARANGKIADPSENGFEPPRHQNQGLMIALGRVLQTYGPEHPLYLDHPLFVQFLDVPAATASKIAKGIVVLMLLYLVAWRIVRRSWVHRTRDDDVREAAALTALCALLSPMTWIQHLTLCIPAAYLVLRDIYERLANGQRPRTWTTVGILAVAVLVFAFQREVTGRELSVVFLSYKVNTLAALILIGLVLALPVIPNRRDAEPSAPSA